ncbi:MAG: GNAT family N-acetyltransferase [Chloroflexota bacterium]
MYTNKAHPLYKEYLMHGLVARWSTRADINNIADLMGRVHQGSVDTPRNGRVMDQIYRHSRKDFPIAGTDVFAIIEDTTKEGNPVVACANLWEHQWSYGGISLSVGQIEDVGTDSTYRNRGLVRTIIAMLHARSEEKKHILQVIGGIPYFYRQFGYEYALDLGGRRVTTLSRVPTLIERATAQNGPQKNTIALRPARSEDLSLIQQLYAQKCHANLIWAAPHIPTWQYGFDAWTKIESRGISSVETGLTSRLYMITYRDPYHGDTKTIGYVSLASLRRGSDVSVYGLEFLPDINIQDMVAPLIAALHQYGQALPTSKSGVPTFEEISWILGRTHPFYDVLADGLVSYQEPPYAWYVRLPDTLAFINHIALMFEQRLADSPFAGHTGSIGFNLYRERIYLGFEQGRLLHVDAKRPAQTSTLLEVGLPPFAFTQLLLGYRSLTQLRTIYPDVSYRVGDEVMIDVLFPGQPSHVGIP